MAVQSLESSEVLNARTLVLCGDLPLHLELTHDGWTGVARFSGWNEVTSRHDELLGYVAQWFYRHSNGDTAWVSLPTFEQGVCKQRRDEAICTKPEVILPSISDPELQQMIETGHRQLMAEILKLDWSKEQVA